MFLLRPALCAHAKAAVVKLDAFSKLESVHSRLTGSIIVIEIVMKLSDEDMSRSLEF